jgi:hypothetical protein
LQQLGRDADRVLVLGDLAGRRAADGWFTVQEVAQLLEDFRLPSPQAKHVGSRATDLASAKLLVSRGSGRARKWALTPTGQKQAVELLGEIDLAQLEPQLARVPGAELGHARHTTLPPTLAPAKWSAAIANLLDRFPFETNVLCMTRFPDEENEDDPNQAVIDVVRNALDSHGLVLHLASDRIVDDDLLGNVSAYMWACRYGIGLFEDRIGQKLNYNLVTEVGAMIMAGRRCALLKDTTSPKMPTDLIGQIYKPVDFDDLDGVAREVHLWAAEDLGLGRCASCP